MPAIESAQSVNAQSLIYLPCHLPPHKDVPSVSSRHRMNMVQLALDEIHTPQLTIEVNDYETNLTSPSYTRNTLEYFYNKYPNQPLYFLIGMDSLLNFHLWYKWQEIFNYCDLLVMQRPGVEFRSNLLSTELRPYIKHQVTFSNVTEVDISSTQIKAVYQSDDNQSPVDKESNILSLMPDSVQQYIKANKLYQ